MKPLFILSILLLNVHFILACDFCNCYIGLNPQYKKNTLGLRYHYMYHKGTHLSNHALDDLNISKGDFSKIRTKVELHGQWYPVQKLQLLFSVPYVINNERISAEATTAMHNVVANSHHSGHGTTHSHDGSLERGIGDPLIIANYQLFNRAVTDTGYSQRLLAGVGLKFPVGKWRLEEGAEAVERLHLPGTGSWDFIANAVYLGKYKKVGLNINLSYLLATRNKESFQFGSRFNANTTFYYHINIKKLSLYPSIGAYLERAGKDEDHNTELSNSGGTILHAHAGLDFYYKKFSLSIAGQFPAIQNLNGNQPHIQYKIIAGISYSFN